ncbi:MAG: hypothetical protein HDR05_05440 [Lachnospiraceae bacterium]|nr:hypothetical protein [Lachnospiraceae bacterium]
MTPTSFGKLINKAGNGNYKISDAPEKLIRYITRTNGRPANDLISWGGISILEYSGIDSIIEQIYLAQRLHTRKGSFGRYMDHEIFSFSSEGEALITANKLELDRLARKMAYDFFDTDHGQIVYAIHSPFKEGKHLHIHFALNTVKYDTGNKRRENRRQTAEREARFQRIIANEIETGFI